MPKLPQDRAQGANDQEDTAGDFKPLPRGQQFVFKLIEVEEGVTGPNSKNPGTPKWTWKLEVDKDYHPELRKGSWSTRQFEHVPLQQNMDWKMRQLFTGFGYTPGSDTDEIIEDVNARIVGKIKHERDQNDEISSVVSRYTQFDPEKFTFAPEVDEDADNQ
jgi:hypothetical protein